MTAQERGQKKRKARQLQSERSASALLPDGTTPKLRASLIAAHKRQQEDPEAKRKVERAKLAKRVQLAKREAGMDDSAPIKFMGMDETELERAVERSLPPRISETRGKKAKP